MLAGGSLSTCDASSLVRAHSCTALSCRYGCCVIAPVYRHWNAVQLPKFRAEPPCCLGCAARWSRRLLAAVQTAQHAMCTAHTAGTRYINIATSQSPALERREQCWRALVGVLCAPAGGTPGPNVQPRPGAKHESFQRLAAVNHDILSHLTNISEAQLHRSSESWPTAWACLPGCACCAWQVHGQAFL